MKMITMKKNHNFGWWIAGLLLLALPTTFTACEKQEQEKQEEGVKAKPVLQIEEDLFLLNDSEQELFIRFTVENPIEGVKAEWRCSASWIEEIKAEASSLLFRVEANPGKERSTTLRLYYADADLVPIKITQAAAGEQVGPTIRVEQGSYNLAATEEDISIGYTILNPTEGSSLKATSAADWVHVYAVEEETISMLIDANLDEPRSTTLTLSYPGASNVQVSLHQAGNEEPDPQPEAPTFSNLSASAISASTATLSCRFDYAGSETIHEAGFCYRGPSGNEQEAKVTLSTGNKSVTLSNLVSDSDYDWYFYAIIGEELYTSDTKRFHTEAEAKPIQGKVHRTTWPELCVEDESNSDYYYAHHITDVTMGGNKARNYTVCFSAKHHCPVWVAAPRHDAYEGSTNRTDAYKQDPQIPSNLQYNSKSTGGGCNKGHMLGSAERTASSTTNKQVFYYSNIAPQYSSGFNTGGGGWNTLEDWIDKKVCSDTTYLVIGTYFEKYTDGYGVSASPKKIEFGGRSDVSCPTMFYVAVLRTKKGNTRKSVINCTKDELMCAAFVRTHSNEHKGQKVTSREMMSIADLEKLTGHQFFVNVPNAPKESFTASEWGL